MTSRLTYTVDDFIRAFRASDTERPVIAAEAEKYNFGYCRLNQIERDQVVLMILGKLDSFSRVGAHRENIWESCWSEAKSRFWQAQGELTALQPSYVNAHPIVRLDGDY